MSSHLTTSGFINNAISVHGDRYDYGLVNYINNKSKIIIICPIHGEFLQTPNKHMRGRGCITCGGRNTMNTDKFIIQSNNIHNNKYDYTASVYKNPKNKLIIMCALHGIFHQMPYAHMSGRGCPVCALSLPHSTQLSTDEFINRSLEIHGDRYDYTLSNYIRKKLPLIIICEHHGQFLQKPDVHLMGCGCPKCSMQSDRDRLYILESTDMIDPDDLGRRLIKFGHSSIRLDEKRKNNITNHSKMKWITLLDEHATNAVELENRALDYYGAKVDFDANWGGYTECRWLFDYEVDNVVEYNKANIIIDIAG
jgi:hypothetical protein